MNSIDNAVVPPTPTMIH